MAKKKSGKKFYATGPWWASKCEGAKRPCGGRVWEGGVNGREIFQFGGSESCNLVHAVMRFLT